MARLLNRLSARATQTITKAGRHADGGGLYLIVEPSGAKRWAFFFRHDGKRREMGLGPVAAVSLAKAREEAQRCRELVQAGQNPIEARRRALALESDATFGEVADQLIEDLSVEWKSPIHRRQWETTLRVDAASLRPKKVATASTEDVLLVLKPIWNTKHITAARLRARIERVFDAAKATGKRSAENPARWRGHLEMLLRGRKKLVRGHHAAMPIDDTPAFVLTLQRSAWADRPKAITRAALEFTILTASRTNESIAAHTREFDLENSIWTVPPERMKGAREHRVALSKRAMALVRENWPGNGYLFPGIKHDTHLSNMAMLRFLQVELDQPYTVHGFRSTFRDWVGDRTDFPRELAEAALAHIVGDETERAYRRSDALEKRRRLMEAWAEFCTSDPSRNVLMFTA